jgi:hypothetical protein
MMRSGLPQIHFQEIGQDDVVDSQPMSHGFDDLDFILVAHAESQDRI